MIQGIRKLFRTRQDGPPPQVPPGERVYAVGDVHGRCDLFDALVAAIEADDARRAPAETTIVLLGDLVDRGPDSAGVLEAARALQQRRKTRIIAGNHEEMFLKSFDDLELFRHFLRYGGRETVLSYPVDRAAYTAADLAEAQEMMRVVVPEADRRFIEGFEDAVEIGDYLFVHAGIRPGLPLEEQKVQDLRWIREPFLGHAGSHGAVVVHGHTITDAPEMTHNRIGIDTGAYKSGRLTALGLEGGERWFVETTAAHGEVAIASRAA
ncbi:MAG TPA: metallophosphoesterase family protein [Novosphingobium sp.]